jgi:hypothetical protein
MYWRWYNNRKRYVLSEVCGEKDRKSPFQLSLLNFKTKIKWCQSSASPINFTHTMTGSHLILILTFTSSILMVWRTCHFHPGCWLWIEKARAKEKTKISSWGIYMPHIVHSEKDEMTRVWTWETTPVVVTTLESHRLNSNRKSFSFSFFLGYVFDNRVYVMNPVFVVHF